jgi:hypothetical protein
LLSSFPVLLLPIFPSCLHLWFNNELDAHLNHTEKCVQCLPAQPICDRVRGTVHSGTNQCFHPISIHAAASAGSHSGQCSRQCGRRWAPRGVHCASQKSRARIFRVQAYASPPASSGSGPSKHRSHRNVFSFISDCTSSGICPAICRVLSSSSNCLSAPATESHAYSTIHHESRTDLCSASLRRHVHSEQRPCA